MDSVPFQTRLAQQSEIAGVVVHEFNNFLNAVLLHLAVLEKDLPENLHEQLNEIRKQGNQISQIIKQWQQYRREQQGPPKPVDLNQILREAATEIGREWIAQKDTFTIHTSALEEAPGVRCLRLSLTADLPPLGGSVADIKQLCLFLIRNALAASSVGQGTVLVHTQQGAADQVALRIEDPAADIPSSKMNQLFEGLGENLAANNVNTLELAACKNLVRRLRGKIQAGNGPTGGLIILVELPRFRPA